MAGERKPFRIRVIETRTYEFELYATDEDSAREAGIKIWRAAPTVGQWETDAVEHEYEAAAISHEPGALPAAHT